MPKMKLTQRRRLLTAARTKAKKNIADQLRPVFRMQLRKLERFLRKSNLRKTLNKINVAGISSEETPLFKVEELFKAPSAPKPDEEQWENWKKMLLIALLLGLFLACEDMGEIENEFWRLRGKDPIDYDPEKLIADYQMRTGRPLANLSDETYAAVLLLIAGWYSSDQSFPDLMRSLNKYFSDYRITTIATTEVGNLLSQMILQQMEDYRLENWYWDALGEKPCHKPLVIKGVTYDGCSDLNGRRFKRGDPMPPDAAHPNCECLPTPEEINRNNVPDRTSPIGDQHPKPPEAGPLTPPRNSDKFLGK